MKNMTQNEMIQKLATLPIWDAAHRSELAAALATERNIVRALIPPNYLKALALALPNVWDDGMGYQRAVALAHPSIWQLIQGLDDRKSVALYLILMEEKLTVVSPSVPASKGIIQDEADNEWPF